MKKQPFIVLCIDCGKEAPVDEEKSNHQWKVYKNKCVCGGKTEAKINDK
jgi:hypothetical protein